MTTRGKTLIASVLVVVAISVLLATAFLRGDRDRTEPPRLQPAAGRRHALRACDEFDRFVQLVEGNARSDRVFDRLQAARDPATAAAAADPLWLDLSGGLAGVEVGIRENDVEASRVSLDVVRAACMRAREPPSAGG